MATSIRCASCEKPVRGRKLFELLRNLAVHTPDPCRFCSKDLKLCLKFPFGLGASHNESTVLDVFAPQHRESWKHGKATTEFWPFLVVLRRHERSKAIWFPYWHLDKEGGKTKTKYGQWAPFMDSHLFEDLLRQARERGHDF